MCSWLAADFSNVAFYSLVSRGDVPVTWADMLSAMAATDVPGLGERAIFRPLSREIIVQQGATIFGVGAGRPLGRSAKGLGDRACEADPQPALAGAWFFLTAARLD